MQIKNNFKFKLLIPLSLINIAQIHYFFPVETLVHIYVFYIGIILNQFMLFIVVADMTGMAKNKFIIPTWLIAPLKLFLLLFCFIYAISHTQEKELILMEIYIFQLIILVLSTKRVVKKN